MRAPQGAVGVRLLGIGDHRPARVVDNHEISARLDTDDSWIRTRTGIATRYLAAPGEEVPDMAAAAAGKALAAAGVAPADVDLVLVATCSLRRPLPGAAPVVASRIGAVGAGAADVMAACAGFCYALAQGADAIRAGSARHVVVVGSERMSDWMDWADRTVCILFGDGAGAVVLGPTDAAGNGVGPVVWGSDGDRASLISIPEDDFALRMDGPSVFRWTSTTLAPVARRACAAAGVEPGELRALVPHQANRRIIDALARSLGLTDTVIARDVIDAGNTSAASVPMALARLVNRGEVSTGDPALLLGFGSGLTFAGQVVRCP